MKIRKYGKRNAHILRLMLSLLLALAFCAQGFSVCLAEEYTGEEETQNRQLTGELLGFKDGYSAILYNNSNGLPTSEANDIVQAPEGFLWIGSYAGLVRYDGNTFERIDSSTGIRSVKCLHLDSKGRLWIGTNESGVFLMEQGELRQWNTDSGLKAESVRAIAEDNAGRIYIGTTGGLTIFDQNLNIQPLNDPRLYKAFIHDLQPDSAGNIYGVTNDGDGFILKNASIYKFISHDDESFGGINYMCPDPDNPGRIYLETLSGLFFNLDPSDYETIRLIEIWPMSQIQQIKKIGSRLWFCSRNGIGVMENGEFHLLENLPMTNSVCKVTSDYEGNLWFASTRQGVMKIVSNQFTDIFEKYDLENTVVNGTCMLDGKLYIATDSGLIVIGPDGKRETSIPVYRAEYPSGLLYSELEVDLLAMLGGIRIRSIIRDSLDRLWISTWRNYGLIRFDHGHVMIFSDENGMLSNNVRAVAECADGSFLAATGGGVNVIKGDQVIAGYNADDGIANTEVLTVASAKNGDILCGTDGGGIYILTDEKVIHIGKAEGLTSEAVMRIKYDEKRDIFWIVTGSSIAWMSADYQLHTIDNFPYSNNFDLYENSSEKMWILSSNGIYVAPVSVLMNNKVIEPLYYGISNGLPCIATANSYSYLSEDGNLYIAGTTGAAMVNVDTQYVNISNLKAAVPYIDADGERLYPEDDGGFTVDAGVRRITIYTYVYNYSLINPTVTYRLKGFDNNYVTVRRSELGPIDYTNLSGGEYSFVIQLVDQMGGGNKVMAVRITKTASASENPLFYVLGMLALLLIAGILVRWYVHFRLSRLEKQHREETEKERMKTELNMANEIQQSMLPHEFPPYPERTEFDIYADMTPAREVGGDFYDFFLIDDDHLCMVIADVSGKGIPAALFMSISKTIVQNYATFGISPAAILERTNDALCKNNQMEMFVTVWLGILEISTGKLMAANAGHEYPYIMQHGVFSCYKDKHGFIIGGMEGVRYSEYEIQLKPRDKVFVYTDGVPEAADADNNMFKTERLEQALNKDPYASCRETLENVHAAVREFVKDAEQFDDLTMLCLEYKGKK